MREMTAVHMNTLHALTIRFNITSPISQVVSSLQLFEYISIDAV
jgi:hypothetical protein